MPLHDHLVELRKVSIRAVLYVFVSFFACYTYGVEIAEILLAPLRSSLGEVDHGQVVYLGILDKVLAQFQLAFFSGIILSSPLWFREVWTFIRPGLYDHEIKIIRPFLIAGFFLFWMGVAFGYFVVFPLTFEMLLNFGVKEAAGMIGLKEYLVLSCKVLIFLGLVFQLPNILLILGFMGLVTKQSLRSKRPYVYVGFSVLSAMITPPDPVTMLMLWLPLVTLFEVGILGVAIIVHPWLKRRVKKEQEELQT